MNNQNENRIGYILVALAAILFAISGACAKALFNAGVTAYQLIQLRTTLAFVGLIVWLAIRYPGQLKISLKDLPYFICLGFFGIGAAQFFYLFAISKINVAAAILLHYTGPVFVALYTAFVQQQRIGTKALAAIVGTLVGSYFVVGAYDLAMLSLNRVGIIGGILAAVAFATYSLLSAYGMKKYTPWTVVLYGMLFAALIWHVLFPPMGAFLQNYSPLQWILILFIGLGGTIVPFGLYFEGIKRIKPTHASITATLEPIAAGVVAAIFLGEQMALLQILGGLLVIISIVWLQLTHS
jgi:drug/metabolite transporter (DMT)-like permease